MKTKYSLLSLIFLTLFLLTPLFTGVVFQKALAITKKTEAILFYSPNCSVCIGVRKFLGELSQKYPELKIQAIVLDKNTRGSYFALGKAYDLDLTTQPVPVFYVGDEVVVGYHQSLESQIEQNVLRCLSQDCGSPAKKMKVKKVYQLNLWVKLSLILISVLIISIIVILIKNKIETKKYAKNN